MIQRQQDAMMRVDRRSQPLNADQCVGFDAVARSEAIRQRKPAQGSLFDRPMMREILASLSCCSQRRLSGL
jgi:hypothetical protein